MFYLTMHSTHFIYGYMASGIWLRIILIVRKETRCCHMGYSFRLTARVLLYAPSNRQDSTYHGLCYTSCGALAGTRNMVTGCQTKCIGSITRWHREIMYNVECYPNEVDQFVVNVGTLGQEKTAARTEFVKEKQLLFLGNEWINMSVTSNQLFTLLLSINPLWNNSLHLSQV